MYKHRLLCLVAQSCLTLCNPMDCSPPGFSVHGILQARILEWVAMPFSEGSSQPRNRTQVSCIAGRFFTIWATKEAQDRLHLSAVNRTLNWKSLKQEKCIISQNIWSIHCIISPCHHVSVYSALTPLESWSFFSWLQDASHPYTIMAIGRKKKHPYLEPYSQAKQGPSPNFSSCLTGQNCITSLSLPRRMALLWLAQTGQDQPPWLGEWPVSPEDTTI